MSYRIGTVAMATPASKDRIRRLPENPKGFSSLPVIIRRGIELENTLQYPGFRVAIDLQLLKRGFGL